MEKLLFNSSYGLKMDPKQVSGEIINFMKADDKRNYKIFIGTDSERIATTSADFVTAIVVHRVGNGGRYFWRRIYLENFHTLRDRILREVLISLDIAKEFLQHFQGDHIPKFDFEIHIDVGENGATRTMIQELVSMVRANNYEARTKPSSCAASNVADRHVKNHAA
ncbi:MAG: ribonuclease H-like YkuK family protein [Patescibacteria group bacterium]